MILINYSCKRHFQRDRERPRQGGETDIRRQLSGTARRTDPA
jgi:hypothetical protein